MPSKNIEIQNSERLLNLLDVQIRQFRIPNLDVHLTACRELLRTSELLDVAVLGRFKAGKSSFLNNLANKDILPIGVIPVTAVITKLRFGGVETAEVQFLNKNKQEIHLDEVASFISESNNPNNIKAVEFVEILSPTLASYKRIKFIDTPGLGSVFKHNTELSLHWLPYVSAAVVATGCDHALSEEDITLISELRKYTSKIVIVLTKADLLTEQELSDVELFVSLKLNERFRCTFPIYKYSVRPSHSFLKNRFEEEFLIPLSKNTNEELRNIFLHKMASLRQEVLQYLQIALEASKRTERERDALKAEILDEHLRVRYLQEEIQLIVKDLSEKVRPFFTMKLNENRPILEQRASRELILQIPSWKGGLWQMARQYESWLDHFLRDELTRLSQAEARAISDYLQEAVRRLERLVNTALVRLAGNVEKCLQIQMKNAALSLQVGELPVPDISGVRSFDIHVDLLFPWLPGKLFRPLIRRRFLGLIPFEVEKNISRLTSQWTDLTQQRIAFMGMEAERFLQNELAMVESALSRESNESHALSEALRQL